MTYEEKVKLALSKATTIDDIQYITQKLSITDEINRRTDAGRKLTNNLRGLCNQKARELIEGGVLPF